MPILKLKMSSYFTVLGRKDRNYLLPVCSVYAVESFIAAVSTTAVLLSKRVSAGVSCENCSAQGNSKRGTVHYFLREI
jgi:hypothetical protein